MRKPISDEPETAVTLVTAIHVGCPEHRIAKLIDAMSGANSLAQASRTNLLINLTVLPGASSVLSVTSGAGGDAASFETRSFRALSRGERPLSN